MMPWITLLLALVGCSGSGAESVAPSTTPEAAPAPSTPDAPPLSLDDLKGTAEASTLVPSPMETQRALEAAGIDTQLSSLIPKHAFDLNNADLEHAAVRSGVLLADLILTVKVAEKEDLLARLRSVRAGMKQLDSGTDIDRTLQGYEESIEADALSREQMIKEFDELSGAVIPELEFNGKERVVPMIQAGSWLEGANLMARAVKAKGNPSAADGLLKQPQVVDYFIAYVKEDGTTPPQVAARLDESLQVLKGLAEKAEPLTAEDIDRVIQVTADVLALL